MDYEEERAANIKANQDLLISLGIPVRPEPVKELTPPLRPRKKRKIVFEPTEGIRTSARSRREDEVGSSPSQSTNNDSSNFAFTSSMKLKKMSPPLPIRPLSTDWDQSFAAPPPTRLANGNFQFEEGYEGFTPNMSPAEVIRGGSFGGTYWRTLYSKVLGETVSDDYLLYPEEWFEGLDIENYLTSTIYNPEINRYRVKASQSIEDWERAGWIIAQDPRGWFQWYCKFFMGRRTADDARQISRWNGCAGPRGRFKTTLIKKIANTPYGSFEDESIAPILRQTLHHWAYVVIREEYDRYTVGDEAPKK